jgi:hypothetical protein
MVIFFFMGILLYWRIEHIFYFVKTRKPLFSNLAKRPTVWLSRSGGAGEEPQSLSSHFQPGVSHQRHKLLSPGVGVGWHKKASETPSCN